MRTRPYTFVFALTLCITAAASAQTLYAVGRDGAELHVINQADGSIVSSVTMSDFNGRSPTGMNGLAIDPTTGTLWGLFKGLGGTRTVGTIDPGSGFVTTIGDTGDSFAGIAFDSSGTLYGVTGDGASTPESLFSLSTTNGSATFMLALGTGDDGESIGFNHDNGLMYHASGIDGSEKVWEEIDLSVPVVVNSTIISADPPEEFLAFTYRGGGEFFMADRISGSDDLSGFFTIANDGSTVFLGDMGFTCKGLALDPPPSGSCVADWNGNSLVDTSDFLAYLNDYNAVLGGGVPVFGDPDLAPPIGVLNTADFLAFLNAFNAGCP